MSQPASPATAPPAGRAGLVRFAVAALVMTGGLAALSWEAVWQVKASLAIGVSAVGTALTLAATMGGIALGALIAGRLLAGRTLARPLRAYGLLELAIGVSGLLLLPGFRLLESIDSWIYGVAPALATPLHAVGILLVLGPPTMAMGATVPIFQLVARSHGVPVSVLYGLNTAGAAIGVLTLSFAVLPALGLWKTCLFVAAVDVLACIAAFALPAGAPVDVADLEATNVADVSRAAKRAGKKKRKPPAHAATPLADPRLASVVVFVTGFVTFGLEVAWFRALRGAFWSTNGTFAIMLASVLIPLAVGARLVPWIRRRGISPGLLVAAAGVAILLATPLVERMDLFVRTESDAYYPVLAGWFLLCLAILGPALLFLGMPLPWCLEQHRDPRLTGRLYGLNAIGSVCGSLLAAWAFLPAVGFARSSWMLGVVVLLTAALILPARRRVALAVAGGAALVLAVLSASSPGRERLQNEPDLPPGVRLLALHEGPDSTVSIVEIPTGDRILLIDGFAATTDERLGSHYMRWMGSLPMLLHDEPDETLVICFGTGQTANYLRREGAERVDVVELSRNVLELAPIFEANEGVLEDPRVRPIVMDGRAWLRRTDETYDVITLEPMPPNFAGVNALYAKEFYEIAAQRLEPGGVLAQWLPVHLVSPEHSAAIAATFHEVFPDSILWIDPISGTGILLGRTEEGEAPLGERWPGLARGGPERTLAASEIREAVVLDPEALERYADLGDVITDDNQLLAFSRTRARHHAGRIGRLNAANQRIIADVAGREPWTLDEDRMERRRRLILGAEDSP